MSQNKKDKKAGNISELTKEHCVSILQGFTGLAIIAWQARLTPATQRNMVCLDYL